MSYTLDFLSLKVLVNINHVFKRSCCYLHSTDDKIDSAMLHSWLNIPKLCDKCVIQSRGPDFKVIDSASSQNRHLPNADLKSQAPVFSERTWDMSNPLSPYGQQLLQPSSPAVLLWNLQLHPLLSFLVTFASNSVL